MTNLYISNLIHDVKMQAEKFVSEYSYVDGNDYLDSLCYECRRIIDVCNHIELLLIRNIPVFYDDTVEFPIFIWSEDDNYQIMFRPKDGLTKIIPKGEPDIISNWVEGAYIY